MEKGLKTLQTTARTAQRKAAASSGDSYSDQGTADHHSDSGIGLGSDTEMEVGDDAPGPSHTKNASSWHAHTGLQQQAYQDHVRSRSLPQPILPLYQPPPPVTLSQRRNFDAPMTTSPASMSFGRPPTFGRYSPDSQNGRGGISIQSVLAPAEPQRC